MADLNERLYAKLAKVGLVTARIKAEAVELRRLAVFLDSYIESREDIKPNTKAHLKRARKNLIDFLGEEIEIDRVTPADAEQFRRHLRKTMGSNTVRRICGRAKQFVRFAARKKLIPESPFADMDDMQVRGNASRDFFITPERRR